VKSGDFPVEFGEGDGSKNRRLAARVVTAVVDQAVRSD